MEGVFSLPTPTKRASVHVDSGCLFSSDQEARKKAKAEADFAFDFSIFRTIDEFCEYYEQVAKDDPIDAWSKCQEDLRERCKLKEIWFFLKSVGREDEANNIQSLNDDLAHEVQISWDFGCKGWILRPEPGPYDDYQRLYVDDWIFDDETGEIMGDYGHLYCTYHGDLAFLQCFEDLRGEITWDMCGRDVQRIAENLSKKYEHFPLETLHFATREIRSLKRIEQKRKERVPFYTKLWQKVVKEEREGVEVLKEIIENDAALYPIFKTIIEDELRRNTTFGRLHAVNYILLLLERIKSYIDAAPKEADLSENYEKLIHKYFYREGMEVSVVWSYANHVERKMKVAKNLKLI